MPTAAVTGRGPTRWSRSIFSVYQAAKDITPARFIAANNAANVARRKLGAFFASFDLWLSPTTARVAEPWGKYHLSKPGVGWHNLIEELFKVPCQFTIPHNIMGTPAMSLPLAMHSSGVPIGVQIAAKPAAEALVLQAGDGARGGDAVERAHAAAARLKSMTAGRGRAPRAPPVRARSGRSASIGQNGAGAGASPPRVDGRDPLDVRLRSTPRPRWGGPARSGFDGYLPDLR